MKDKDKEKWSFGGPTLDCPPEFLNKYVICYLKNCISGTGSIGGLFTGIKGIKGENYVYFEAEEGHDFIVPTNNVAYLRLMSDEILNKQQDAQQEKKEDVSQTEETSINDEIKDRMNIVQEQMNASESESPRNSETETDGDSEFVFKV